MFTPTTFIAFLIAIGVLVTFHELGHYWAARLCDVRILRFSIGFGRPLYLRRVGPDQTEWVIAALPLGGYVRMADERDGSAEPQDGQRAFNRKSVWQRIFIVSAGPLANFLLAIVFYWFVFVVGVPGVKPYVAQPVPGSVAAKAGFAEFDLITRVGDREVQTWNDAMLALLDASFKPEAVEIEVEESAGHRSIKLLSMSSLQKGDIEKNFLGKLGLYAFRPKADPVIDAIDPAGAAAKAGLRAGDRILASGEKLIPNAVAATELISAHPGQAMPLLIDRDGVVIDASVVPDRVMLDGKAIGRLGIGFRPNREAAEKMKTTVHYGPLAAVGRSLKQTWDMSIFNLKMMGRMITGDISWKNLSGPISIAEYAGKTIQQGWLFYVGYLAMISIGLGVLNLLPIPVLDGGQLMYYMAELLTGSPVSERVMEIGQQVGLTLLLGLTAFAFYNDIHRLAAG